MIFRRPRDNCNTYAQDIWSYLCELQNHDASTDPSVVIDMAYHVTRCAFMLHKHEATGHLPPDVMSALDAALDLSVEPKPGSYHPPHPIDSIEFAKIFDLGMSKQPIYTFAATQIYLLVNIVCLNRPLRQGAHQSPES